MKLPVVVRMTPTLVADRDFADPKAKVYVKADCWLVNPGFSKVETVILHVDVENGRIYHNGKEVQTANGQMYIDLLRKSVADLVKQ